MCICTYYTHWETTVVVEAAARKEANIWVTKPEKHFLREDADDDDAAVAARISIA